MVGTQLYWTLGNSLHAHVPAAGTLIVTDREIRFETWFLWRIFADDLHVPLEQVLDVSAAFFFPAITGGIAITTADRTYRFQVSPWRRQPTIDAINVAIADYRS